VTEALWPHVQATGPAGMPGIELPPSAVLATAAWPSIACSVEDEAAAALFERTQSLVNAIRNKRGERQVQPKKRIRLQAPSDVLALIKASEGIVESLAGLESVSELAPGAAPPPDGVPFAFEGREVILAGLVDAVDAGAERARLEKTIADRERQIAGFRGKLDNPGYIAKAKPELVEETKAKLAEAEADIAAARRLLGALGG
jgi:valyl-tRNA synthetase